MKKVLILILMGWLCTLFIGCESGQQEPPPEKVVPATGNSFQPVESNQPDNEPSDKQQNQVNPAELSNTGFDWYFQRNSDHCIPYVSQEILDLLDQYSAFYVIPNPDNKIYLTFDCGYELGYTGQILDVLAEHDIKAAFFITGHYIESQPDLVQRMVREGHLVCSHTWGHPDLSTLSEEDLSGELERLNNAFQELTGVPLQPFLRPPMGRYSEQSLAATSRLGYSTVFWSMAWKDWDPNQQPGADYVYQHVMDNIHPGAVVLLHVVSQSDTEALDRIISGLQEQGYICGTFK